MMARSPLWCEKHRTELCQFCPRCIDEKDKRIAELKGLLDNVDDILLDVLYQACNIGEEMDNMCLSPYEDATSYLEKRGRLEKVNDRIFKEKQKE